MKSNDVASDSHERGQLGEIAHVVLDQAGGRVDLLVSASASRRRMTYG